MRVPSEARLGDPHEDAAALFAADDLVRGGCPDFLQIGGVELQLAPEAAALVEGGGADAVVAGPKLLVERQPRRPRQ